MDKQQYMELAEKFIEKVMGRIISVPSKEEDRFHEKSLSSEEKEGVLNVLKEQFKEGKAFAGVKIIPQRPKDGKDIGNLTIQVINKDEKTNQREIATHFANAKINEGKVKFEPYITESTLSIDDPGINENTKKIADLYKKIEPKLQEAIAKDNNAKGASEVQQEEQKDGKDAVQKTEKKPIEKTVPGKFNIREHMEMDEIAKLDQLPEPTRDAIEAKINETIPAEDITEKDKFVLSLGREQNDNLVVYVYDANHPQANMVMGFSVNEQEKDGSVVKAEVERGGLEYQKHWRENGADMDKQAKAVQEMTKPENVSEIDKTNISKEDAKTTREEVNKSFEEGVKSQVKGNEGKPLTPKDIDNPEVFSNELVGRKIALDNAIKDAMANGFDEKSVKNVEMACNNLVAEIKNVSAGQEKTDQHFDAASSKEPANAKVYEAIKNAAHENANAVKQFGLKTLDIIGESCAVALVNYKMNRATRGELDDEFVRQQERRFYAIDYSAAKIDISRAEAQINKIQEKYERAVIKKNMSFINRLRGKVYTLKDVMPDKARDQIKTLNKFVATKERDLSRIKNEYEQSLDVSKERLAEIRKSRDKVGLTDKKLDRKLEKQIENVAKDKGLDVMDRER